MNEFIIGGVIELIPTRQGIYICLADSGEIATIVKCCDSDTVHRIAKALAEDGLEHLAPSICEQASRMLA